MSGHSSVYSSYFNSIMVRRVRPSPASEANRRTFCLGMGAPTQALSSVLKRPFLCMYPSKQRRSFSTFA